MKKISKKRERKKGLIKKTSRYFEESLNYVKESKTLIYFIIGLFVAGVLIGFLVPGLIDKYVRDIIEQLINEFAGLGWIEYIVKIFGNNLEVSVYSSIPFIIILKVIASGANIIAIIATIIFMPVLFITGIIPLFLCASNGLTIGYVLALSYNSSGFSQFWRLLPHGVFELPAIFISLGMGLKLGWSFFTIHPFEEFKKRLLKTIKVIIFIVIPLLLIAAVIEGTLIYFIK